MPPTPPPKKEEKKPDQKHAWPQIAPNAVAGSGRLGESTISGWGDGRRWKRGGGEDKTS